MTYDPHAVTIDGLLAHQGWVRGLARHLVFDRDLAEDVEQDVWVAALTKPPAERGNLAGWLSRVLRRRLFDARRREKRRRSREGRALAPGPAPSPEEVLSRAETRARVAQAVLALQEPYRSTVLLRFFEDMLPVQIAALQGVPLATVRTRVGRAMAQLRDRLAKEHGPDPHAWRRALVPLAGPGAAWPGVVVVGGALTMLAKPTSLLVVAALLALIGGAYLAWGPDSGQPALTRESIVANSRSPGPESADAQARPTLQATEREARPDIAHADRPVTAGTIAGRLEDEGGQAIAGAEVLLWDAPGRLIVRRASVDAQGRFRFEELATGLFVLTAHGPGGSTASAQVRSGETEILVALHLPAGRQASGGTDGQVREGVASPPGVLTGAIEDASGRAVGGALVLVWEGPTIVARTTADEAGTFRLNDLGVGRYVITVLAPGLVSLSHPARSGGPHLTFVLERGLAISGVVVEAQTGVPLGDVPILALPSPPNTSAPQLTRSRDDGTFSIAGLAQGPWILDVGSRAGTLAAHLAEFLPAHVGPLEAGARGVEIRLRRGLVIEAQLLGPSGLAWENGAEVRVTRVSERGEADYGTQRTATVGRDGRLRVAGLAPGRLDLTVIPDPSGAHRASLMHVSAVEAGTTGLILRLKAGAPITGRVVDEAGRDVTKSGYVWVSPVGISPGAPGSCTARLSDGGRFETPSLDPELRYVIRGDGFEGLPAGEVQGARAGDKDVVVRLVSVPAPR